MSTATARYETAVFSAGALLAVFAYLHGLDDVGIPSNGDENVYIHIARKTLESGHWLPLATDIEHVRNTKPPFLFWQGIVSTEHGSQWTLWRLRLPTVLYSLATAGLLFALLRRLQNEWRAAVLAALIYLGFYSTFRYGRPFLTDAPVTFWLTVPGVAVLWSRGALLDSRVLMPLLFGIAVGIACLYKSFALVVPFSLALFGWLLDRHGYRMRDTLPHAVPAILVACVTALAIFTLWPLLDPAPEAIWHDFVLKENAGKLTSGGGLGHYLKSLVWGNGSIAALFIALLANAGLLAPILLALIIIAWRQRHRLGSEERLLWIWILAFFIAFSLPSQRSGRYLLPVMPALAALAALTWQRLPRLALLAAAAASVLLASVFGWFVVALLEQTGVELELPFGFWLVIACAAALGVAALVAPRLTSTAVPLLAILIFLAMGLSLGAYATPPGPYAEAARERLRGEVVFVPCNFVASEEAERFLLPGADVRSYSEAEQLSPDALAARYRFFAAFTPLGQPPSCAGCRVVGMRYVVRGRHIAAAPDATPLSQLLREFFEQEVLFQSTREPTAPPPMREACDAP